GYMESLQTTLSSQISELYTMADALEGDGVQATDNLDLEGDRARFENEDFAASTEMTTAIDAMETAVAQDATESDRTQANTILGELSGQISGIIENLQNVQIPEAVDASERDNDNLDAAENRVNNPPEGTDLNALYQARVT